MIEARVARELVARLAVEPRPAGSVAEESLREFCAGWLRDAGFEVEREPFSYSTWPGRYGTPASGAAFAVVCFIAATLAARDRPGTALVVLVLIALTLGVAGRCAARSGVSDLRAGRTTAVNLVATRGEPKVWLVAHLDSKSQPVPMLLRAAGIVACVVVWIWMVALAVAQATQAVHVHAGDWHLPAIAAAVAALPVAASVVTAKSPGAIDNASGVAAVLLAAQRTDPRRPVGVLLTSAEELGLAGARAFASGRAPGQAINFDGLDDGGWLRALTHGRRGPVEQAARKAAGKLGVPLRITRGIPGVLTDAIALRDGGWDAVTLVSGTLGTLYRVHSSRDRADTLTGAGIAAAATLALRMLEEIS